MRAYYIFEKFAQDSDPIKDMNIGIFVNRNFNSKEAAIDWIMKNMHLILEKEKIPAGIIYDEDKDYLFKWRYYNILNKFILKYISINNKSINDADVLLWNCYDRLRDMGYPKKRINPKTKKI